MTKLETWADNEGFFKRFATAERAETALHRSAVACAAGVLTPVAQATGAATVVRFDRIATSGQATLTEVLAALHPLHRMPQHGLQRYDPFARIRPRLAAAGSQAQSLAQDLLRVDRALGWAPTHVVHGDLHPGQVLRDQAGQVWVIDLDDLALAPPEADLGNLAAWMATQAAPGCRQLASRSLEQITAASPSADPGLISHFYWIALLRRGLKLRERGQASVLDQLLSVH